MTKPMVMITDDQAGIRESIKLILADAYRVTEAASGAEALECLRREPVQVVFMDIALPGMNGLEALESIKRIKREVPVCMLTSMRDAATRAEAERLGAFDFITKPFEIQEILDVTARMVASADGTSLRGGPAA
mgnify:CR=1 FL=1